ncbi:MAG: response regulator transcription factor [Methyloceanibacter sp.]
MGTLDVLVATADRALGDRVAGLFSAGSHLRVALVAPPAGNATFRDLKRLRPALFIVDPPLLGAHRRAVLMRLRACAKDTRVLVVCNQPDEAFLVGLLAHGARGCVDIDCPGEEFVHIAEAIIRGELWFGRPVMAKVLADLLGRADQRADRVAPAAARLTARESEIVQHACRGLTNKEIARLLGVSDKTVKTHLQRIFEKRHIHHRVQLAPTPQSSDSK